MWDHVPSVGKVLNLPVGVKGQGAPRGSLGNPGVWRAPAVPLWGSSAIPARSHPLGTAGTHLGAGTGWEGHRGHRGKSPSALHSQHGLGEKRGLGWEWEEVTVPGAGTVSWGGDSATPLLSTASNHRSRDRSQRTRGHLRSFGTNLSGLCPRGCSGPPEAAAPRVPRAALGPRAPDLNWS